MRPKTKAANQPCGLQPCSEPSCVWCPQCALCTFSKICHPKLWPADIYAAIFGPDPPPLNHAGRVRVGFFFYANGAWQDFELFYNLLKPRLSAHVSKAYMHGLFRRCERSATSRYTTQDALACNDRVHLDGAPALHSPHISVCARKMSNWERHINGLLAARRPMPSHAFATAFFSDANRECDPRLFRESVACCQ